MEYFLKTKYVRLKSLHNKYLVASENGKSIKQSRNGNSIHAYWGVERVVDTPNLIRLRSYLGKLLTASDKAFLLGWTGDTVVQSSGTDTDPTVLWEPVKDHSFYIRLRTPVYDKFLRANGGGPPWRNSVTVDMPECAVTHEWILWTVDVPHDDELIHEIIHTNSDATKQEIMLSSSSLESQQSLYSQSSSVSSFGSRHLSYKTGVLDLHNIKTIQLLIFNDKYVTAHEDGETVFQGRDGSQKQAYWTVEHLPFVEKSLVRLKSSYQKYLTATDDNFLLGATGKKVKQTPLKWLDYSIEWELIKVDNKVMLKTWNGHFLKANGGVPPWRNSITHDLPSSIPTTTCMLWQIDVFDVYGN